MSWWSLPETWGTVPLGPLVKIKSGFACAKKNLVTAEEGIAQLRPFNIATNGRLNLSEVYYIPPDYKEGVKAYALEPGHVLFNNTNSVELVGKTALVTEPLPCAFSNHIYRLTVKAKSRLDPGWLALALRALWVRGYFAKYCNRWIGQAGFNQKMLRAVEIPVPPLDVQRCIVARIKALFAELAAARRTHAAFVHDAERLMDAVLKDTFDEIIFPLSNSLNDITQITSGGTPLRSRAEYYTGDIPWVKTGELNDSMVLESEEHITQQAVNDSNAKLFPVGTLLIAMYGQGKTRGRTGILGIPATTNQACCALLPAPESFLSQYLQFWFRSMYRNLRQQSEMRGGNQPNLNAGMIKNLRPPLPPLLEQRRIVAYLDEVQAHTAELQRTAAALAADLDRTKQAILAQAFRESL